MLFNNNNNGSAEMKELLGFLYISNNFDNIKTDILLVEEDMAELIGQALMDKAQSHYDSTNYNSPDALYQLLNDIVHYIQLPVAYYAYHNFAAHTDISHGEDGRKVVIDPENQKMAWEWMINRDDNATLNKAHKTTDRLIAFLDKNIDKIPEWKDSDALKASRALFINDTKTFDSIFPIDNSRRFFLKIIPFIKETEQKHLLPVLGQTRFSDMKAAILSGKFTDKEAMLQLIRVPLAYFTISLAVKRLSVTLLPNGILQDYISDRMTMKASLPAPPDVRRTMSKNLYDDAVFELQNLQKEISQLDAIALGETYVPTDLDKHIDPNSQILRF